MFVGFQFSASQCSHGVSGFSLCLHLADAEALLEEAFTI